MNLKDIALILFAFFIQAVFSSLPFGLIVLFVLLVIKKDPYIFVAAFIFGILLDIFLLRIIGSTAVFYMAFLFFVNLYEKKIESENVFFVVVFTFLGSLLYFSLFNFQLIIVQSIFSAIFAGVLFKLLNQKTKKRRGYLR